MEILPLNTFLGELEIVDIFEFYDMPLLFTCINKAGDIFIAVAVEEGEDFYKWIYSKISEDDVLKLKTAKIDFRDSFLASKNGYVFNVVVYEDAPTVVTPLSVSDLDDDFLPCVGEFAGIEDEYTVVPYRVQAKKIADATEKAIFNLVLDVPNSLHEAPARCLGKIICELQNVIDAIGLKLSGHKQNFRGAISSWITDQTKLNVASSFPGSFGIQLRSSCDTQTPAFTLIEDSLVKFFDLINLKNDHENLLKELHDLDKRVISNYLKFFDAIQQADFGFHCQFGSPRKEIELYSQISIDEVKENFILVNDIDFLTEDIDVEGVLKGVLTHRKTFEILGNDSELYTGAILDEAMEEAKRAQIGSFCSAVLRKENYKNKTSNEIKTKWSLLKLENKKSE